MAHLLRTKWRRPAEELLFEGALPGSSFLRPDTVRTLWQEHQSGRKDNSYSLWSFLIFALFLRR